MQTYKKMLEKMYAYFIAVNKEYHPIKVKEIKGISHVNFTV